MEPFFKHTKRQQVLRDEAERWKGTPFVPFQGVRQGGCDCVHLCYQLIKACGFAHEFQPPPYTLDATSHRDECALHDYLDNIPGCERIALDEKWMVGDFVTFVIGRAPHHLGVMIKPPFFIHVMHGLKTGYAQIDDPTWGQRLARRYRLYEL